MSVIQFTTVVGPDGAIHPPPGVDLPEGEIEVSVRPRSDLKAAGDARLRELCAQRGLSWDSLTPDVRTRLLEDLAFAERGVPAPRSGPGACQGAILYMAPDFDAPLEELKEYME